MKISFYRTIGKRLIDFFSSLIVLIILFPFLLIVSIVLFFQNKGKVFFFQERPGLNERPFHIIKFKTMNDKRGADNKLLPDNERITPFGSWLRKLSIDEIPQMLNVVKGDMSLIGPRPLLFRYIPLYNETQRRRHEMRPGITGWAQVNGRNAISWKKKFELDVNYIDHCTFAFDCKIVYLTIIKVLKRDGINQSSARPMLPFTGNETD